MFPKWTRRKTRAEGEDALASMIALETGKTSIGFHPIAFRPLVRVARTTLTEDGFAQPPSNRANKKAEKVAVFHEIHFDHWLRVHAGA